MSASQRAKFVAPRTPHSIALSLFLSRAERVTRYAGDFMPVAGNIKSHLSTFYVGRLIISGKSRFFHSFSLSLSFSSVSFRHPFHARTLRSDLEPSTPSHVSPARAAFTLTIVKMIVGGRWSSTVRFINPFRRNHVSRLHGHPLRPLLAPISHTCTRFFFLQFSRLARMYIHTHVST